MEQEASNQLAPSRKLRFIRVLSSVNVYGLFFGGGVAIANVSRLFPYGGMAYAGLMISIIGLSLLKAEVDIQKLIIIAISVSGIAFWDAIAQFFFQPIFLGFWIIPLWQCLLFGISGLMILIGLRSILKAKD
ncbi:MAG: hypothetical protein V7L23_30010 [Nostoc sp.]|uniref:hypothetical protein n=1 Tax=Nostoc sp. TaxID=1180 RepID=UPI002FF09762